METYPLLCRKLERSLTFLFEFSKGKNDMVIDFFIDFLDVLKNDQSLQEHFTFENASKNVVEFVFYFCQQNQITLSLEQKITLQSILKKLVYVLGNDLLMSNLEKKRFKLW
jgi:hypothetical protein